MGDWKITTLGDVASFQRGHDLPDTVRIPGCVPVMGSFGITGWHNESRAKGPGVTVGRSGASIGVVSFIGRNYWPLNTCLFVTDFHGNNPKFVYYFLKTIDLAAHNSGSAQQSLNRNYIHPLPVSIPERQKQDNIATLLGALDDKIELNRRMNETLEAMARAIFKDWFVDFGPTRAKAEGSAPYLVPEIWALFPARLDDEDTPEGWRRVSLGELVAVTKGRSYTSEELRDGPTALVTLKSFQRGGGYRIDGLKPFSGTYKPEQVVRAGEIVVAQTDVTQAADIIGRPAIVLPDARFQTLVASLDVAIVRPCDESHTSREFLYQSMNTESFIQHTYAHTSGTTVLHLSKNAVPSYQITLPGIGSIRAFDAMIVPLRKQVIGNEQENRQLTQLRDLLLPKLISGEIRLRDAEKIVEAAA
jgi:type I restriction enzyme, S subunit